MTLDSGNIRFMRIFGGFRGKGASYNSGVIENVFLRAFGRYVFGTLGNKANIFTSSSSISISLIKTVKTQLVTIKEEEAKMIATVFV